MKITRTEWNNYVEKLSKLSDKASKEFADWAEKNGGWSAIDRQVLAEVGWSIASKYAEGSSALAAEMYDAIAYAEKANVPQAELAADVEFKTVAKAINGALKTSTNDDFVSSTVGRAVKQAGADTMLKNASRDQAEFAWIPSGDSCPFCLVLASNGWRRASKKTVNGGHAEHIHTNCNCQFAIRFNKDFNVEGYNPEELQKIYYDAKGSTPKEKLKSLQIEYREENKAKLLANLNKQDKMIIEAIFSDAKGYADDKFDRKTEYKSRSEDLKAVNPNYDKGEEYKENCQRCCPTYLLRLQGYDVIANPDNFGHDENINFLLRRAQHLKYVKADGTHPQPHFTRGSKTFGKAEIEEFMKDLPDGAILEVACSWNQRKKLGGGHVFIAEKENGEVKYKDPQNGLLDASDYFNNMIKDRTTFVRIDDTKVDEDLLWYIARNNR